MCEKIWLSGISECGKGSYLSRFQNFCTGAGKKSVRIFQTGDMIFEIASKIQKRIRSKNILQGSDHDLDPLKAAVFERILGELGRRSDLDVSADAVIISDHFCFHWRKGMISAHASFGYLPDFDPRKFICFIDGPHEILKRLKENKEWSADFDEEKVVLWQETEIAITKIIAQMTHRPWYVLPSGESEEVLYRLAFDSAEPLVYVSIPITNLSKEDEQKVNEFVKRLHQYFPALINPLSFPVGKIDMGKDGWDARFHHAIKICDLFIEQADIVVCYTPSLVPTDGVPYEQAKSYEKTKEVWVVHPLPHAGPHKVHFCNRLFKSEEEFFEFLKKRRKA